jgi:cellobiose transport system substrate-binding protein
MAFGGWQMNRSWTRVVRAVAAGAAAMTIVAACSGEQQPSAPSGPVTLTINFWGNFGFNELKPVYEAAHPNVKIVLNSGEYNAQHELLQQKLVAGSGAPTIAAIDEGFMNSFRRQADKFVNLLDKGAADFKSKYFGWKWEQSLSPDGKVQIGIGTDVGGQAMCYRTDLFQAAGLATDRAAVSALWPTWDAFIEVGRQYVAKTKKKFIDNGTNLFNPILAQQPVGFYDQSEALKMEGGPKVAFDLTMKAIDAGLSANLPSFSQGWDAGFAKGEFAVLGCPAWMLGHIKDVAPGTSGKWDIAAIPGGGGNWGGSFLTIPKQGDQATQDAAWEFIKWVSQPEQQITIFKNVGNLPSQPALYDDPAIKDFKNEFMGNAPTGQIFGETSRNLTPQYLGRKNGPTRVAVENVINEVQAGNIKSADAWAEAVKKATEASNA